MSKAVAALLTLSLMSGCAAMTPPKSAAELLAQGDLRGALRAAASWQVETDASTRQKLAQAVMAALDPSLSISAIPPEELAKSTGMHAVRGFDPAWAIVRPHVELRRSDLGEVEIQMHISSGDKGLLFLGRDPKSLSILTREHYPPDTKHSKLKTGDFPWPVHVLTFGVLTLLTTRIERTYTPPPIDKVRAAVPRAIALSELLDGQGFVLRRPARDDEPLVLDLMLNVSPGEGGGRVSLKASIDVPSGGRLEDRLARAVAGLRLASTPTSTTKFGGRNLDHNPCDKDYLVDFKDSPCIESAKWPTDEITPIGLEPPPVPEKLGTPEESLSARPWWEKHDYAPMAPLSLLGEAQEEIEAEAIEGGLLHCKREGLHVPREDMDRVFARIRIGKELRTVDGMSFTLPLLSLGPKAKLRLSYYDGDWLSAPDHLVTLTLVRKGNTMSATVGSKDNWDRTWASVKCKIFDRTAVEAAFKTAWQKATDMLDACEEAQLVIKPEKRDFGMGDTKLLRAQRLLGEAAGLVGWSDVRVKALVERWSSLEKRFWAGVRQSIEGLSPDATSSIVLSTPREPKGKIHGARMRCGEEVKKAIERSKYVSYKHYDCAVELSLENLDKYNRYPSSLESTGQLVLEDGRVIEVRALERDKIPPGMRSVVTLVPKTTPPPGSRASKPWSFVIRDFGWSEIVRISQ